jgi:hypothetical protein
MPFLEELFTHKKLSDSSKKLYMSNLIKLNSGNSIEDFNFLRDINKIETSISKYGLTTQRSFIIAVISIVKTEPELYKIYFDLLSQMNGKLKQKIFEDNYLIN